MDNAVGIGPFGGCGGSPFDTGHTAVLQNIKITQARDRVAIEAKEINVPPDDATIKLEPEEFLTGMTAYVGQFGGLTVVRSLSFVSNLSTFGPYGPEEGTPYSVTLTNGRIVGFFGFADQLVNAIGVWAVAN